MSELLDTRALGLLPALLGGCLLGTAFYGSLWWTVRRGLPSPRPALWFIGSMALRIGCALGGIYLIGDGHWERLASCLVGFVIARPFVARLTRPATLRLDGQRR
jgi:F1F0 ATPase subunit 2